MPTIASTPGASSGDSLRFRRSACYGLNVVESENPFRFSAPIQPSELVGRDAELDRLLHPRQLGNLRAPRRATPVRQDQPPERADRAMGAPQALPRRAHRLLRGAHRRGRRRPDRPCIRCGRPPPTRAPAPRSERSGHAQARARRDRPPPDTERHRPRARPARTTRRGRPRLAAPRARRLRRVPGRPRRTRAGRRHPLPRPAPPRTRQLRVLRLRAPR